MALHKRWQESKSYNDFVEYKRARNRANKEVRRSLREFEVKLARRIKKEPKAFYSYVR